MPVLNCAIPRESWAREVSERNGVSVGLGQQVAEKAVEDAGPWEPAVRKIITYQHLGDNWDGFGAKPPSRELLVSAVGLAYLLSEEGVEPPHRIAPGVDGCITLEWQFPDGTLGEVEIVR